MTATSRTLQHVGEWKVELRAATIEELFTELARVLADAVGPSRPSRTPTAWERVELAARDYATLIVDWANELVGRSEVAGRAYRNVRNLIIERTPAGRARLAADVNGDPVDEWVSPVKAATYHDAVVEPDEGKWRAVVLFDV
ncbi:MAG: archease [Gemmatimonas sp.]|nr:archease [Gemmatimonadaceae bacterium]